MEPKLDGRNTAIDATYLTYQNLMLRRGVRPLGSQSPIIRAISQTNSLCYYNQHALLPVVAVSTSYVTAAAVSPAIHSNPNNLTVEDCQADLILSALKQRRGWPTRRCLPIKPIPARGDVSSRCTYIISWRNLRCRMYSWRLRCWKKKIFQRKLLN